VTAREIHGDTANLKVSHVRALQRLAERTVAADRIISAALARDVVELACELNRRIGLFIDRRGRVVRVILGDAHSVQVPEFARVRGVDGRLRGIRLVIAHLVPEPIDREELADLTKLRLDMLAAIHRGPSGLQADLACLTPSTKEGTETFVTRTWPRAPMSAIDRDDPAPDAPADLPVPFDVFLRELEASLVAGTARARAQLQGTRAMALLVHDGGDDVVARKQELRELCRTAQLALVELVEQRRPHPDPRTFFGQGKLRQILVRALEQDVEVLVCDPELTASQAHTISKETDLKVIDRTMLILDIFAKHAKSSDGKLQVELAQLRYNLPKMIGKGTTMSRLAGGIGGTGPGESKLEIDRRRAKERIGDLDRRLGTLRRRREQQRADDADDSGGCERARFAATDGHAPRRRDTPCHTGDTADHPHTARHTDDTGDTPHNANRNTSDTSDHDTTRYTADHANNPGTDHDRTTGVHDRSARCDRFIVVHLRFDGPRDGVQWRIG